MKSRWDEVKSEERRRNSAKVRRKKIHPRQMLETSRNAVFFQWFLCRVSPTVGLLKRRARSHVVKEKIKNCTRLAKRTVWSENVQNTSGSEHFWKFWCFKIVRGCGEKRILKWKCAKHVRFGALLEVLMSKNCTPLWREAHFQVKMLKELTVSEHFLKFGCRKIARRCGKKHMRKSKCARYLCFGTLFEVQMSKN